MKSYTRLFFKLFIVFAVSGVFKGRAMVRWPSFGKTTQISVVSVFLNFRQVRKFAASIERP